MFIIIGIVMLVLIVIVSFIVEMVRQDYYDSL